MLYGDLESLVKSSKGGICRPMKSFFSHFFHFSSKTSIISQYKAEMKHKFPHYKKVQSWKPTNSTKVLLIKIAIKIFKGLIDKNCHQNLQRSYWWQWSSKSPKVFLIKIVIKLFKGLIAKKKQSWYPENPWRQNSV